MRVLLFVEPYCVRSGPQDFATPAQLFGQIAAMLTLGGQCQTAVVCSSALARQVPRQVQCFTPAAFGLDEAMAADWLGTWTAMLKGERNDGTAGWADFYQHVLAQFQPGLVYLWNTNGLFERACDAAHVARLTFEYGAIRTPAGFRIAIDPQGFGPSSAAAKPSALDHDRAQWGWDWVADYVHREAVTAHHSRDPGDANLHVAVLLQKEDDVNFLLYPAFADMRQYVVDVLSALINEPDVRVTVRPHPAGLLDYRPMIEADFPGVSVSATTDWIWELLNYDAAISLNSAGGFEALLAGVPTMTLTPCSYCGAFAALGEPCSVSVSTFIDIVRRQAFWTPERYLEVGGCAERIVRHFSVPQELLLQPRLHRELVRAVAGRSPLAVRDWFETTPAPLQDIVDRCRTRAAACERSQLRIANHRTAQALARIAQQEHAAVERAAHHDRVLAEMSAQNAERDRAIAELARVIAEMSAQNAARDLAIAKVNEVLAEMTQHNDRRDQAIAAVNDVLAAMTRQNESRDAALAQLRRWPWQRARGSGEPRP